MEFDIKNIVEKYKFNTPTKRANERGDLIKKFVDRLNQDRVSAGYKEMGFGTYVKKMSDAGIKTLQQLYLFYGNCNDSKNFSKFWWWYIKQNKIKKNEK